MTHIKMHPPRALGLQVMHLDPLNQPPVPPSQKVLGALGSVHEDPERAPHATRSQGEP